MNAARVGIGVVLGLVGIALIFLPDQVATALDRPPTNPGEAINLRASWGGSVAGLGGFVAVRHSLRPWAITIAWLVVCSMAGIGVARAIGFVLDGSPDTLQWIWLVAEAVLVVVGAAYLRRRYQNEPELRASS